MPCTQREILVKNISMRHATSFSCDEYVEVNTKSNKLLKQKQFRVVLVVDSGIIRICKYKVCDEENIIFNDDIMV